MNVDVRLRRISVLNVADHIVCSLPPLHQTRTQTHTKKENQIYRRALRTDDDSADGPGRIDPLRIQWDYLPKMFGKTMNGSLCTT